MVPKLLKYAPSNRHLSNSKLAQALSALKDLGLHLKFNLPNSGSPMHLFSGAKLYK